MINLKTSYLGLELKNPVIVGSSRLTGEMGTLTQCVEKGASAVVIKSLFEEQIVKEAESRLTKFSGNEQYFWFPEAKEKVLGISVNEHMHNYLEYLKNVKKAVDVPVISSINCTSAEGWPNFAAEIEKAGADALELNIAVFPFSPTLSAADLESIYLDIVKAVKAKVKIPVSVKLGHYFTNMLAMAKKLNVAGADGLVLFNRFFRPDIDVDTFKIIADDNLSSPNEYVVPMRWIALLNAHNVNCDLVASTGVHNYEALVRQLLAGAKAAQLCSTLYLNGLQSIEIILKGLEAWMKRQGFKTIDDFRGKSVEAQRTDAAFERIQYIKRNFAD